MAKKKHLITKYTVLTEQDANEIDLDNPRQLNCLKLYSDFKTAQAVRAYNRRLFPKLNYKVYKIVYDVYLFRKQKKESMVMKYVVIVNKNNAPYKCTVHNSLNEAIESIGKIYYDWNDVIITKENFEEYFEKDENSNIERWIRKDYYGNPFPVYQNEFILKI